MEKKLNTENGKTIPDVVKKTSKYWIPVLIELIKFLYDETKKFIEKKRKEKEDKKEETLNNNN